jgi:hypothetical protein
VQGKAGAHTRVTLGAHLMVRRSTGPALG